MKAITLNTLAQPVRSAAAAAWALAIAAVLALVLAPSAFANIELTAPSDVVDDVTHLEVAKLDADTHAFVKGAKLCIVEKSSGAVVDEWTSGSGIHDIAGLLDVNTVYVLQELEAPSGYQKAGSVEFRLNETAGSGIEILSGSDGEKSGDYRLDLYDTAISGEKVVHKTNNNGRSLAQTWDENGPLIVGLAVAAVLAIALFVVARRRANKQE